MAAPWGELMSLNVSRLGIQDPVLGSQTIVDGESKDSASDSKKGFFYTHWGVPSARQPSAAPWFALTVPEVLSFRV